MAAQRDAMKKLAMLDGTWRGEAWHLGSDGKRETITQTERVGPMLDGTVRVVEGRGYDKEGQTKFNAFAVISFNTAIGRYTMRSYTSGRSGDYDVNLTTDGFVWSIPAQGMTIRYSATVKNGTWHEVGDYVMPNREPVRFMEMTLKRIGDSDWPAGGPVPWK